MIFEIYIPIPHSLNPRVTMHCSSVLCHGRVTVIEEGDRSINISSPTVTVSDNNKQQFEGLDISLHTKAHTLSC